VYFESHKPQRFMAFFVFGTSASDSAILKNPQICTCRWLVKDVAGAKRNGSRHSTAVD
jgi:hypothetical protein